METQGNKKQFTNIIILAAIFLAIGAGVVYFLIIMPSGSSDTSDIVDTVAVQDTETEDTQEEEDTSLILDEQLSGSDNVEDDTTQDEVVGDISTQEDDSTQDSGLLGDLGGIGNDGSDSGLPITAGTDDDSNVASWTLTKESSMFCDTSDSNLANVLYSVTLTNTSDFAGEIAEIVDTLPSFTTSQMVGNISNNGEFNASTVQITWDNSGSGFDIAAGGSVVLTYSLTLAQDLGQFGEVQNAVTALPSDGSVAPPAANNVTNVACGVVPETAIGDDYMLIPILIITGTFIILAALELQFGWLEVFVGQERMENWKISKGEGKEIVEKRLLGRKKSRQE